MNFIFTLLHLSSDQIRISSNYGDNFIYDRATFFDSSINLETLPYILNESINDVMPKFAQHYPTLPDNETVGEQFFLSTGFISYVILKLANFFIDNYTIRSYSNGPFLSLLSLVILGFIFNFCISIRVEVSKIRLTFLSFISLLFTFLILVVSISILNARGPLWVHNSGTDMEALILYAWNCGLILAEPETGLVKSNDLHFLKDYLTSIGFLEFNQYGGTQIANKLYQNENFLKLTKNLVHLEHDIYGKGEFHKSSSYFNKLEEHSNMIHYSFEPENGFTVQSIANGIIQTVIGIISSENGEPVSSENFLNHTPLNKYESARGTHFFILSSCFCLFFLMLLFLGFSDQQFLNQNKNFEFIWLLWLFIISGLLLLMTGFDLIEIFIALECLSFCSYILISLERSKKLSSISGIRYLIISALPSALLILGIIFLYKKNISFNLKFIEITNGDGFILEESIINKRLIDEEDTFWQIQQNKPYQISKDMYKISIIPEHLKEQYLEAEEMLSVFYNSPEFFFNNREDMFFAQFQNLNVIYFYTLILISIFFIISNLSFKLSAAPFHFWAPVIYNNGLLSSVIFLNILLKLVIFLFLVAFVGVINQFIGYEIKNLFLFFALMSFFFGAGGAINERFIKRFFVYSSMVDVGFILLVFSFYDLNKIKNILLYLLIYNLSSMIIWFFLLVVRKHTKFLTNLTNILNNNNLMKFIFSFVIFSMAGIPPFGGFFIKYNILKDIVNSENMWLSFIVLLFTILTLFYYLRLIKIVMFDNINNNKALNLKNNNFKYILFALLLNFVVFFLIFMQESFLLIFDSISNFIMLDPSDLMTLTDRFLSSGVIQELIRESFSEYYKGLNNYLGSEHYIKRTTFMTIVDSFDSFDIAPNFKKA